MTMKTKRTTNNFQRFMKPSTAFSILLLLCSMNLLAQSYGEIHGRILDASTGESIPGANVFILINELPSHGTSSDAYGYFRLKPVPLGIHNVTVSFVGYGDQNIFNVQVDADKISLLADIHLIFGENLPPVIIISEKLIVDPHDPSKETMDMIVVKKLPNTSNFTGILAAMTSNIYVTEDMKNIHFRGARANDAVYIVDGVKVSGPGVMIPTRGIGSMTVYSGGVPAKYGDFTGGVIIVESESYFSWYSKEKSRQLMNSQ
jgi:hypothetical protein